MGCNQSVGKYINIHHGDSCCIVMYERPCINNRPVVAKEQVQIVRESWVIIKRDIAKIGIVIFLRLVYMFVHL